MTKLQQSTAWIILHVGNDAKVSEDLTIGDQRFKDYKRCMLDRGYALRTY